MNRREIMQGLNDLMVYGMIATTTVRRAWYNPMRWIKGEIYQKRINPKDMYVKGTK